MNWDRITGHLKQLKGRAREQWGKVTNNDRTVVAGQGEQIAGKVQEGYGVGKDKVVKAVDKFTDSI